jgi:hypothetical protein
MTTTLADLHLQIEYAKKEFEEITLLTHQSNCGILQLLDIIEQQKNTINALREQVKTLERTQVTEDLINGFKRFRK